MYILNKFGKPSVFKGKINKGFMFDLVGSGFSEPASKMIKSTPFGVNGSGFRKGRVLEHRW